MPSLRPVAVVGLPWDGGSSFLRGPADAPPAIRAALWSSASNRTAENGVDLEAGLDDGRWRDAGDLAISNHLDHAAETRAEIERTTAELLAAGERPLALGGDHSVSLPLLRAQATHERPATLVQLDAHPDLYDELDGDRHSHACPFARILEEGLAGRLVQIGVRTMNAHQRAQARRFEVEVIEAWDLARFDPAALAPPFYLSVDLDVLDPAFAPGVSHREPGGLSTRQVLDLVKSLPGPILGADLVELNPRRDPDGSSAQVAAKLVKEMLAAMLAPGAGPSRPPVASR